MKQGVRKHISFAALFFILAVRFYPFKGRSLFDGFQPGVYSKKRRNLLMIVTEGGM